METFESTVESSSRARADDFLVGGLRCEPQELIELVQMAVSAGGSVWVRANSGSMAPTIRAGSDVRLDAPEQLAVGTVALARLPGGLLVLHRIHAIQGDLLRLRGDASAGTDPAVARSAVLACASVVSVDGKERMIGARPWISVTDVKRWIRPLTSRVRRLMHSWTAARRPA